MSSGEKLLKTFLSKLRVDNEDEIEDGSYSSSYSDAEETLKNLGIYYIVGDVSSGSLTQIHQDILLKHINPAWQGEIQLFIN